MKTCTKCKTELEATLENFGKAKQHSDGLKSWCRVCTRVASSEYRQTTAGRAYFKEYGEKYHKGYRATLGGYLGELFNNMNQRCSRQNSYVAKYICNEFRSAADLYEHVVNELKVDPRGKDCHRIDNDGNYARGNIEFLTEADHKLVHAGGLDYEG
jgi:hypothetical protein